MVLQRLGVYVQVPAYPSTTGLSDHSNAQCMGWTPRAPPPPWPPRSCGRPTETSQQPDQQNV